MTERSAAERVFDAFRVLNHELAITANTDGYFTWTSAGVSELLGWSQEELCSCKFIEYVHPDDVERTLAVAGEVRPDGSSVARFENRYRCRDGSYRWIEWRAVTIGDETRCLVQDISARKAAEQRAEERLEWLKMAERLAGVGHWRLRLADKHLEWSDEVYRIHGLDPCEDTTDLETAIEFYHPEDRANVAAGLEEAVAKQQPFAFELRIVRRDGEVRTVQAFGECNVDEGGAVSEVFGVFVDVTEQRLTDAQLRRHDRLVSLGTMAGAIGHQVNNPLTYVLANLEQVLADSDLPSKHSALLREAMTGAERISSVVQDLRLFSEEPDTRIDLEALDSSGELAQRLFAPAASVEDAPDSTQEPGRPLALIVDDDVRVARSMARSLNSVYSTEIVLSGAQALTRLARDPTPEVVLLDIVMPDLTGIQVFERLSAEVAGRVVFITGGSPEGSGLDVLGARCLVKPFSRAELLDACARR